MPRAAALLLVIVAAGCGQTTVGDGKLRLPPVFELEAAFERLPRPIGHGDPVRIAGVHVGRVAEVERRPGEAIVRMRLEEERALPLYADAEIKVRPRIFREGDWFLDLTPGTGRDEPEGG